MYSFISLEVGYLVERDCSHREEHPLGDTLPLLNLEGPVSGVVDNGCNFSSEITVNETRLGRNSLGC